MNSINLKLIIAYSLMIGASWAISHHSNRVQEAVSYLQPLFQDKVTGHKEGHPSVPESTFSLSAKLPEPDHWNLQVEGFSPAYYDKVREAIAINTVDQPTDQWGAASSLFELPTGSYTIRFTSLLESDGECTYIMRMGGNKVMEFQNPRIHGKGIEEYSPHEEVVENVSIEKGSRIQVEFLPHSNGPCAGGRRLWICPGQMEKQHRIYTTERKVRIR
ncbi:hypothetical protein OKW21_004109 [Catalinimonas alkaloidigena]|uniref:hypothetical protein n=1 Tax=Catalinimonas alkaloidigena TaxID=1075417 RepID=UPI0024049D72|nr:hypothetical protein [Catalinimonas alkaloidigena]MDF9798846.1 hypothetical protein [Catalinimonas alkaloidigena]